MGKHNLLSKGFKMDYRVEVSRTIRTLHLIKDVGSYTAAEQLAVAEHRAKEPCQMADSISTRINRVASHSSKAQL